MLPVKVGDRLRLHSEDYLNAVGALNLVVKDLPIERPDRDGVVKIVGVSYRWDGKRLGERDAWVYASNLEAALARAELHFPPVYTEAQA